MDDNIKKTLTKKIRNTKMAAEIIKKIKKDVKKLAKHS